MLILCETGLYRIRCERTIDDSGEVRDHFAVFRPSLPLLEDCQADFAASPRVLWPGSENLARCTYIPGVRLVMARVADINFFADIRCGIVSCDVVGSAGLHLVGSPHGVVGRVWPDAAMSPYIL